jgi:hypothetical protein
MTRVAVCLGILFLIAPPRDAGAVPIEYHISFALTAEGPADFLGVTGATFDLWTTLDPDLVPPPPNEGRSGRVGYWNVQPGTRLQISGCSGFDGTYGGEGWMIGIGNDTTSGDYVLLQEFSAMIAGHRLNLGPIFAQLPTSMTNPLPGDPLRPFTFENSDVLAWGFSWADSVETGSRYRPTIITGSARPVGVPEPSSLMLLGLGFSGVAARAMRKRIR